MSVNYGASQTFTIAANSGYHIVDVSVDGASQGAVPAYTFTNIVVDHTISATFAANLTITTINPSSGKKGNPISVTITGTGYQLTGTTQVGLYQLETLTLFVSGSGVSVTSTTQITCTFNLPGGSVAGFYDVGVTNPDGYAVTKSNGFEVTNS